MTKGIKLYLLFILLHFSSAAFSATAQLNVSVTIPAVTNIKILNSPKYLIITEQDIANGYVETEDTTNISIYTNVKGSYNLLFDVHGDFIKEVVVKGFDNKIQLSSTGGNVIQSSAGVSSKDFILKYRFTLQPFAKEGSYTWPIQISAIYL